jgi:Helix-turn-helix domain
MNIALTKQQQKRIEIIERALRNDLTVVEAAMVLGVSERQCYRLRHGLRIRESKEWSMATGAGM